MKKKKKKKNRKTARKRSGSVEGSNLGSKRLNSFKSESIANSIDKVYFIYST